jgi:hypothetical protein
MREIETYKILEFTVQHTLKKSYFFCFYLFTSRKMLRKKKTVFAVVLSSMDRGDVAAATES